MIFSVIEKYVFAKFILIRQEISILRNFSIEFRKSLAYFERFQNKTYSSLGVYLYVAIFLLRT